MDLYAGCSGITSSLRIFLLPATPSPMTTTTFKTEPRDLRFQENEKWIPLEDRSLKVGEKGNIMWKKFLLYRKKKKKEAAALSLPGKQANPLDLM